MIDSVGLSILSRSVFVLQGHVVTASQSLIMSGRGDLCGLDGFDAPIGGEGAANLLLPGPWLGLVREALGGFLVREADCPVAVVPHVSR